MLAWWTCVCIFVIHLGLGLLPATLVHGKDQLDSLQEYLVKADRNYDVQVKHLSAYPKRAYKCPESTEGIGL